MNKRLIAERFSKAITTYPKEANVQRQIAGKMIRLLTEHIPSPCSKVIEFGCGTGIYSRMLLQALRPEELLLNDLCPDMKYCCEDLLMKKQVSFLPGDAETVSFPTESTLITSCSALQWFESPENFFERCNTLLNNQGYFAFSTFGKENMKEIRELTGNGLPYRSREELEVALSPHFDILYSEEELIPLSFEDPIKVLYHLKQTGVNGLSTQSSPTGKQENDLCSSDNNSKNNSRTNSKNNLPQQQWTRRDLQLFCERYTQEFTQGDTVVTSQDIETHFTYGKIPHFCFNYLDYILLKKEKVNHSKFYFSYKDSIEHFYPQNPKVGDPLPQHVRDSFGNLGLVNQSENSTLTNDMPIQKAKWLSNNKKAPNSLKLELMMEVAQSELEWNEVSIEKHQQAMVELLLEELNVKACS